MWDDIVGISVDNVMNVENLVSTLSWADGVLIMVVRDLALGNEVSVGYKGGLDESSMCGESERYVERG